MHIASGFVYKRIIDRTRYFITTSIYKNPSDDLIRLIYIYSFYAHCPINLQHKLLTKM
jgi:hypothetical protein